VLKSLGLKSSLLCVESMDVDHIAGELAAGNKTVPRQAAGTAMHVAGKLCFEAFGIGQQTQLTRSWQLEVATRRVSHPV
jgi:hypothetical protein